LAAEVTVMAKTKSQELAALCSELAHWRKYGGGGRGKRIPAGLWEQAAAVARVAGVVQTARVTRLNFDRLEACMVEAEGRQAQVQTTQEQRAAAKRTRRSEEVRQTLVHSDRAPAKAHGAQFVSVQLAPVARSASMSIELISRSGERMRIESTGALDLAGVVQSFWSSRS
jgi:hypothetical protein